jgi:hypothetical protein
MVQLKRRYSAQLSRDEARRLALVLLLQMRGPEVYGELVRNSELLRDYLRAISGNAALRGFLDQAKGPGALERRASLARGEEAAAEQPQ